MNPLILQAPLERDLRNPRVLALALGLLAVAYYLGAEAAFFIGTLSDRIFAPFWPPNIILFWALLLFPMRLWWLCIAVAFPAHVVAELGVGMPAQQYLVAFVTNCAVAMMNAYGVRRFVGGPDYFGTLRQAAAYVLVTVIVSPAIAALGGAFVPLLSSGDIKNYWVAWAAWYGSNAVAAATLGPLILIWFGPGLKLPQLTRATAIEKIVLLISLMFACAIAFSAGPGTVESGYIPTLLYLPMPLVLWAAIRFGDKGASAAILAVTFVSVWRSVQGSTPFDSGDTEQNVFVLQVFLTAFSVPVLLLGSAIEELRTAKVKMQHLAGSLLRVQDEERRRIARTLHDSMGQNLAGAKLLISRLQTQAPEAKKQPIKELGDIVQQSIRELQTTSYLLHPPLLDEAGLSLALRSYIKGFSQRSGIDVDFEMLPSMERLPADVELALFRVVQEALTNVHQHSESPNACINLRIEPAENARELVLTVEDFGKGIMSSVRLPASSETRIELNDVLGLGLKGVRERLRQLGGRFHIHSASSGTIVTARVPLAAI
jgi:signal transduction histidine kinase